MKPDHRTGREAHRELHKVMDDRQAGKISHGQAKSDMKELKRIRNEAINPMRDNRE